MEGNKEEAAKCIELAEKCIEEKNREEARKFLYMAEKLYPTQKAKDLLLCINLLARSSSETDQPKRQKANVTKTEEIEEKIEYTAEQEAAVKRIEKCKDYYEILSISRNATDFEIKKAYKKLALLLHPDKNKHPGASEVFKSIGNAVAVLTDPGKRKEYDLNGSKDHNSNRSGTYQKYTHQDVFNMFFKDRFNFNVNGYSRWQGQTTGSQREHHNYQREKRNMGSRKKSFPLHKAVEYRSIHKIKILLPKTKDINDKNPDGYTPLLLACEQYDKVDILDLLLTRKDIDITITNKKGFTALHILTFKGNLKGLVKVLKAFPQVDINKTDDEGDTPLIKACKMCHFNIIEYLLTKGADVKHANKKCYTALHHAANYGHKECVELLIKSGAEVDAKDDYNLTPLMKASKWGFKETCEVLIRNGADVNASAKYETPLSSSCVNNTVDLTKLLISHGAKVGFPGPYSSALIACAREGSVECAKVLINAGVKVHENMENGKTALDVARQNNQHDMVRLLSVTE